jgi:hypothetical protein
MLIDEDNGLHLLRAVPDWWLGDGQEIAIQEAPTHFGSMSLQILGRKTGVEVQLEAPRRNPPERIVLHLPKSRPLTNSLKGVEVLLRENQTQRWDFDGLARNIPTF